MSIKNFLVASLLFLYLPPSAQANIQISQSDIEASIQQAALRKVSQKSGIPIDKLEIVYTYKPAFQAIGKNGFGFIIIGKKNGKIFDIAVDTSGQEMDLEKLAQQDNKAYVAKYGKLSPDLYKRVIGTKYKDRISVVITLKVVRQVENPQSNQFRLNDSKLKAPTQETVDIQQQRIQQHRIENERVVNQAINEIEELGFNVTGDDSSPAVYGNLTPAEIRAIEKLDIVDRIEYEGVNQPE